MVKTDHCLDMYPNLFYLEAMETIRGEELSRIHQLAHRLEQDIQRRGCRAGDKYITAEAAGQMLGVSRMTANRAMSLLARRKVLVRFRSRGTFVGPRAVLKPDVSTKTVHFITFVDDASELHLPVGAMLAGLQTAIPQVSLQSHCMPLRDALACVQREVDAARNDPSFGGFVLCLGTRQVQQCLAQSGLPAVVHGSVYAGIALSNVESDQEDIGRLMVRSALAAGHRRMVWVNRELWRRGDEVAFDGMIDEVQSAGLPRGTIAVRNTPVDLNAMEVTIQGWLDELETPLALLCREPHAAQVALRAAKRRRLRVPRDIFVVYDDTGTFGSIEPLPNSTSIRCKMGLKEVYGMIGKALNPTEANRSAEPSHVVLPVVACSG